MSNYRCCDGGMKTRFSGGGPYNRTECMDTEYSA